MPFKTNSILSNKSINQQSSSHNICETIGTTLDEPIYLRLNVWQKFALAATYVSRLPLCKLPDESSLPKMAGLAKYLPAVGLLIGLLLAAVAWILSILHTGAIFTAALLTVVWLAITGGIHFDGLMDTADGVFSNYDQKRILEIMSDSRVGNFGAMTGWCTLLLKFAALASMSFPELIMVLIVVPIWARWCETYAIGLFSYLREFGMGKIWHDTTLFPRDIYLASIIPVLVTALLKCTFFHNAATIAAFTVIFGLLSAYGLNHVLKGHTGDTYGATVELAETGAVMAFILFKQFIGAIF